LFVRFFILQPYELKQRSYDTRSTLYSNQPNLGYYNESPIGSNVRL
jgi:hypothetical protein